MNVDLSAAPVARAIAVGRASLASGWEAIASLPDTKGYASVFVINNKMYVASGYTPGGVTDSTYMYDPVTHTWSQKAGVAYYTYSAGGAAYNGKGYLTGGYIYGYNNYGYVQEYNPTNNSWTYRGGMYQATTDNQSVAAPNGRIYTFGGNSYITWFDPVTGGTGYHNTGINNPVACRACLGADGWIYVTGGDGGSTLHYKFNPLTATATVLADLPEWRHWHTMVLYKGLHYIMGGHKAGQSNTPTCIAYDPVTNTYSTKQDYPMGVAHAAAAVLTEDGLSRIIVTGGHDGGTYVNNSYRLTARETDLAATAVAKASVYPFASAASQATGRAVVSGDATVSFGESFDAGIIELTGIARPAGTYPDMVPVRPVMTMTRPNFTSKASVAAIATKVRGLRLAALNNDLFANATNIFGSSGDINGQTTGKTVEVGEPEPLPGYDYFRSSWYRWTAPSTGEFRFTTFGSVSQFGYADMIIAAYTGTNFGNLQTIAYSDESPEYEGPPFDATGDDENEPAISFMATSGTSYYLVVATWSNNPAHDKEYKLSWEPVPTTLNLLQKQDALISASNTWRGDPYWPNPNTTVTRTTSVLSRQGNATLQIPFVSGTDVNALFTRPVNVVPGQMYTAAFDGRMDTTDSSAFWGVDLFFYDTRDPNVDGWSSANKAWRWFNPDDQGWGYAYSYLPNTWGREYTSAFCPAWANMAMAVAYVGLATAGSTFYMGDPSFREGLGREWTAPDLVNATVTQAEVNSPHLSYFTTADDPLWVAHGREMRAWIPDPFNWAANPYYTSDFHVLTS